MTIIAPPDALTNGKTEQVAQLLEQHVKKNRLQLLHSLH